MKKLTASLAVITALIFTSCSKDNSEPSAGNIQGTWKITSMHAKTSSTLEFNYGGESGKNITTTEYDTKNNTGTLTIDASNWVFNNIGYSVTTIAHTIQTQNGQVVADTDIPLNLNIASYNGTTGYEITGDSVFLYNGFFSVDGSASTAQAPTRGKISINGNTMTFTEHATIHENQMMSGIPFEKTGIADGVMTFERQ